MTIKDIARECGVSVSTVSRVLNKHPDVSDPVRRKVMRVVEERGYIPNNSARDLVRSSSDAVGVIVRGTGNLFFSSVIKTISRELEARGYTMVLHFLDTDADEVKAGAVLEREKKLRGLIFLGGRFDYSPSELSLVNVPYVCCSYTNYFGSLDEGEYSSVSIDDFAAAYAAVEMLIRHGHRRIAAVVPSCSDRSISELRCDGFQAALRDRHDAGGRQHGAASGGGERLFRALRRPAVEAPRPEEARVRCWFCEEGNAGTGVLQDPPDGFGYGGAFRYGEGYPGFPEIQPRAYGDLGYCAARRRAAEGIRDPAGNQAGAFVAYGEGLRAGQAQVLFLRQVVKLQAEQGRPEGKVVLPFQHSAAGGRDCFPVRGDGQ